MKRKPTPGYGWAGEKITIVHRKSHFTAEEIRKLPRTVTLSANNREFFRNHATRTLGAVEELSKGPKRIEELYPICCAGPSRVGPDTLRDLLGRLETCQHLKNVAAPGMDGDEGCGLMTVIDPEKIRGFGPLIILVQVWK